jgi:hypothetical protein
MLPCRSSHCSPGFFVAADIEKSRLGRYPQTPNFGLFDFGGDLSTNIVINEARILLSLLNDRHTETKASSSNDPVEHIGHLTPIGRKRRSIPQYSSLFVNA